MTPVRAQTTKTIFKMLFFHFCYCQQSITAFSYGDVVLSHGALRRVLSATAVAAALYIVHYHYIELSYSIYDESWTWCELVLVKWFIIKAVGCRLVETRGCQLL